MPREKWIVQMKKAPFREIGERFGIDQVIARIIRNRGIESMHEIDMYLNGTTDQLNSPHLLMHADAAAAMILEKIRQKRKIRVIGDYDIDGVNSAYILTTAIKRLGGDVDSDIPERLKDGYGLNERLIEVASDDGVDTIVTCDNGIAAVQAVRLAKQLGMTVVVTDHHEPQYRETEKGKEWLLPPADILVDPKLEGDLYPFKEICGAVTAWKVVQIMYEMKGLEPDAYLEFLPFAAFATVGDVMDLRDENRIIVKWGLRALETTDNYGMRALIRACGLEETHLEAYHIGFILGPCINASGRLETARKAMALLTSKSMDEAEAIAHELQMLNEERKEMTIQGTQNAIDQIENEGMRDNKVMIVYLPGCHESIAGIIAGKVRERFNHPAIVMTDSTTPGMIKGSGRSIEGYEMFEELTKCADLLDHFGGHTMAAGLSMKRENLKPLRDKLNGICDLPPEAFDPKIMIDVPMPVSYITENLIDQLSLIEPCGKGNEKPLFAEKDLHVVSAKLIGKERSMLKMVLKSGHVTMDALYFGQAQEVLDYLAVKYSQSEVDRMMMGRQNNIRLSIVYYPSVNEFRGERTLQVVVKNYM